MLAAVAWRLRAIDGRPVGVRASLRIGADNVLSGAAPCNRYPVANRAKLPALDIGAIRSTRMACPWLDEERVFLETLPAMTAAAPVDGGSLVLTGPEGRRLEFLPEEPDSTADGRGKPTEEESYPAVSGAAGTQRRRGGPFPRG